MTMLPADCAAVTTSPGAPAPSRLEKFLRVVSVATMLMTVPQVIAVWVDRDAAGVSLLSWSAYLFSACLWFVYGIQKRDKTIYMACACIRWIALTRQSSSASCAFAEVEVEKPQERRGAASRIAAVPPTLQRGTARTSNGAACPPGKSRTPQQAKALRHAIDKYKEVKKLLRDWEATQSE